MNGGDNSAVLIGQAVFYRLHRTRGEEVVMSLSGKSMLMAAILLLTIELDYQLKIAAGRGAGQEHSAGGHSKKV